MLKPNAIIKIGHTTLHVALLKMPRFCNKNTTPNAIIKNPKNIFFYFIYK